MRTACAQVAAWCAGGFPHLRAAVNLSRCLCQHHNLVDLIEPVLKDSNWAPEGLELELTESVLIQDRERTVSMLCALSVSGGPHFHRRLRCEVLVAQLSPPVAA